MNESSMLYKTSKALLIKNKNRYAFGEAVVVLDNPYYDGNRLVIGKYHQASVVDEAVELTDKEKLDKFEESSYEFLNALNHGLRNYDSHFNISGRQYGDIYIQENAHDDSWSFSSSEDDYSLMQECAWNQYLYNKARIQSELKSYVKEASIITNESLDIADKIDELTALSEEGTFSDTWTKFKNFIAKMWAKFGEFIARTVNSDKNYLTKYKEIILNRKYQLEDVEVDANYDLGVRRLSEYNMATPDISFINGLTNKEGDPLTKEVQGKLFKEYNNSNIDFTDFVKNWFKGGSGANEQKFQVTEGNINMTNLYNYCYNFEKIENVLKKNSNNMINAGRNFEAYVKDLENNKDKQAQETTVTNSDGKGGTTPSGKPEGGSTPTGQGQAPNTVEVSQVDPKDFQATKTPQWTVNAKITGQTNRTNADSEIKKAQSKYNTIDNDNSIQDKVGEKKKVYNSVSQYTGYKLESATFSPILGVVINEEITRNKGAAPTANGTGGGSGQFGNATTGAVRQTHNVVTGKNVQDAKGSDEYKTFENRVNAYTTTCTTIFGAMLGAAQTIKKDYMGIIKMHVQSYLGNADTDKTATRAGTNYGSNLNVNFDDGYITRMLGNDDAGNTGEIEQLKKENDQNKINQTLNDAANHKYKDENGNDRSNTGANGQPLRSYQNLDDLKAVLLQVRDAHKKAAEQAAEQQKAQANQQTQQQGQPAQGNT